VTSLKYIVVIILSKIGGNVIIKKAKRNIVILVCFLIVLIFVNIKIQIIKNREKNVVVWMNSNK